MFSFAVIASISCTLAVQVSARFDWDRVSNVIAFGDSYTFIQGSKGHPAFSFIGDALNFSFTPSQLLHDRILPRNTSSDGANWVEFLTHCQSGLPGKCTRQLWDFAFAGADIDAALLPRHHDFTVPLVDQVEQWVQYASHVLPRPFAHTLVIWWIGINDTGDTVTNSSITDFAAFWDVEMKSYFNKAVQVAYDHGLYNHLFLNVPPGERSPANLGDATKAAALKEHIRLFNRALDAHIERFAKAEPQATVIKFDAHALFNDLLDNPSLYGFTNTTGFCTCANPEGFFWFNSGHPTEKVHELLAQAVDAHLRG